MLKELIKALGQQPFQMEYGLGEHSKLKLTKVNYNGYFK